MNPHNPFAYTAHEEYYTRHRPKARRVIQETQRTNHATSWGRHTYLEAAKEAPEHSLAQFKTPPSSWLE